MGVNSPLFSMINIAVCISTRNRPKAFRECLENWNKLLPESTRVFIVDDASKPKYTESDYSFRRNAGIPKVKNKCLELAMNSGAKHIFLADDDIYPIDKNWFKPYIESGINHLSFTFTEAYGDSKERSEPIEIDGYYSHRIPCGCLLYFTRKCIDYVGGFDERFGLGTYEHVDLTRRVYEMGLTPHLNMDVIGSERLFYSMDREGKVSRTFSPKVRKKLIESNRLRFYKNKGTKEFIPYC